jgi:ribosomal protein L11 methyltransferase
VRLTSLADRNWKHSWKRHFKPLEIGGRLLLRPSWSKRRAKPGQSVVVLDPGLSFGTGQHPTTSFCLQELVKARRPGADQSLLDMGTGSGILAIAAAKLGYQPVHAFDYDPESVRVASTNAKRNRVDRAIRFRRENLSRLPNRSRQRYDVVCANLLADLLAAEAVKIINRVKPGGTLIIAGILETEFRQLERVFLRHGLQPFRARTRGEWRSGSYRVLA